MPFDFLSAISSLTDLKNALGTALNRCEVDGCTDKNLSLGGACFNCGHFCCNAHGFVPLSAIPLIIAQKRPVIVCQDCIVVQATS